MCALAFKKVSTLFQISALGDRPCCVSSAANALAMICQKKRAQQSYCIFMHWFIIYSCIYFKGNRSIRRFMHGRDVCLAWTHCSSNGHLPVGWFQCSRKRPPLCWLAKNLIPSCFPHAQDLPGSSRVASQPVSYRQMRDVLLSLVARSRHVSFIIWGDEQ